MAVKVLVADDDPISLKLLETYLGRWGYTVTTARDGSEAWSMFERDAFDIVVTDWMMPHVDGLELIRRIRATPRGHYVYALLLTARTEAGDIVQGMETGADDFIGKPFDRDELRVRVREGERVVGLELALEDCRRRADALAAGLDRLRSGLEAIRRGNGSDAALDALIEQIDRLDAH